MTLGRFFTLLKPPRQVLASDAARLLLSSGPAGNEFVPRSRRVAGSDAARRRRVRLSKRFPLDIALGSQAEVETQIEIAIRPDVVVMTVEEQTSKVVVTVAVDSIEPGDVVVPRRQP